MSPNLDDPRGAVTPGVWPILSTDDRFSRVIDALPDAYVLVGAGGLIEMANRRAEEIFGYRREELTDRPLDILLPQRFRAGLRTQLLAARFPRETEDGRDLLGLRKDGTEFPVEICLNPMDLDGRQVVFAGIADITIRHQIELDHERQRLDLARSNTDLEDFAYVASHDLKAPLRAISHLVEWIVEDVHATASAETSENLGLLRGRVGRLQSLLDGLLSYARVGRGSASFEPVDIAEVVRDAVAVLSPPPGFVIACEGPMPSLLTHRAAIMGVLLNLISNGVKHHDRAEGRITVSMSLADGVAEFRVGDDGPGIPPRFHERIFVIFQTLENRDDVETSGIGLAIVKKRVEGHGGQIRVESAPPARGTTIVFTWKEPAP